MKPPLVTIAGRKGGTGKTSLCLSLAGHYTRAGLRVLVIDLDPQGSASLALGADADGEHLAAVLDGAKAEPVAISESLQLLPGGPALETITNPRPLRETLKDLDADLVLVDCPPGHPTLDRLALNGATVVLVAAEPHRLAIAGAARVLDEARTIHPKPRCAVVLGRLDERRGMDRAAPELLAGAFNTKIFTLRQDTALAAALNSGELPPAVGRAADDLREIAQWLNL